LWQQDLSRRGGRTAEKNTAFADNVGDEGIKPHQSNQKKSKSGK